MRQLTLADLIFVVNNFKRIYSQYEPKDVAIYVSNDNKLSDIRCAHYIDTIDPEETQLSPWIVDKVNEVRSDEDKTKAAILISC